MNNENEYIGFLTTIVTTANGALPIKDARVTIYNNISADENTTGDVMYSLTTDQSGRTEKVALKTKSKDLSTEPGNPLPFLTYDIYVNADGYYDATFFDVPIFQGVSSLQNVHLIPLSEFSEPDDFVPNEGRFYPESKSTGKYAQ